MKIYVTSSFGDSKEAIERLCSIVRSSGHEDFNFMRDVENYQKVFNDPQQLMRRAKDEIQKSDAFLIDMTDKPTGRAIEAGIAYAFGKKIIVIMKRGTAIKDTTRGIADMLVEYNDLDEIAEALKNFSKEFSASRF
jgi:nucleoside 2-deoxyribosyltransferase